MRKVTVHQAKTHLSRLLREVEAGEIIIICRGDEEVAWLTPAKSEKREPRKLGLFKGQITLPDSFFEPLPPGYDGFPIDE